MALTTTAVPLEAIELDWSYYPREELDEARILEFRDLLRDPESAGALPPVELVPHPDQPGHYLAPDGWHRIHAHLDEARQTISAVILPGDTDVFLHSVQRAAVTAKPLTRAEKRTAVTRLLAEHPDWSNHRVAAAAGVSRPLVAQLRAGGNVAPSAIDADPETGDAAAPAIRRGPDPAQRALRSLIRAYVDRYGRTKFGFGRAIKPTLIRSYLESLADDDYDAALGALRAWAEALADEASWLPAEDRD